MSSNVASWKLHYKWRLLAGKIIELNLVDFQQAEHGGLTNKISDGFPELDALKPLGIGDISKKFWGLATNIGI